MICCVIEDPIGRFVVIVLRSANKMHDTILSRIKIGLNLLNSTIVLTGCLGPIRVGIFGSPAIFSVVFGDMRITYIDCV